MLVSIKSHTGIGDMLFATPSFPVIKRAYPKIEINVSTRWPMLLSENPWIDKVTIAPNGGLYLGYPDPQHGRAPTKHHILSDWELICKRFRLETDPPELKPEIHFSLPPRGRKIVVQIKHRGQWHGKKIWPYFDSLARVAGYEPIPDLPGLRHLVNYIAAARLVICAEGGISHIAKAVGTPAVVVYGGWAKPEWNGYPDHANIVNVTSCSPCYNRAPCRNQQTKKCFVDISLDQVLGEAERLLRLTS